MQIAYFPLGWPLNWDAAKKGKIAIEPPSSQVSLPLVSIGVH